MSSGRCLPDELDVDEVEGVVHKSSGSSYGSQCRTFCDEVFSNDGHNVDGRCPSDAEAEDG